MKNMIFTICLFATAPALAAPGDGAHGTEAERLYLAGVLANPQSAKTYESAILEIENAFQQETFKKDLITWIQQIPSSELKLNKAQAQAVLEQLKKLALESQKTYPDIPYDFSRVENPEASLALAKEIYHSKVDIQTTPCIDKDKVPREATTNNYAGSPTCVYVKGLALMFVLQNKIENRLITVSEFLFGTMFHETARKFNLDGDHSFFRLMIGESNLHDLVYDQKCYTQNPFCETKTVSGKKGRVSWAPYFAGSLKVDLLFSKPNGARSGGWGNCKNDNFIIFTGVKEIPNKDKYDFEYLGRQIPIESKTDNEYRYSTQLDILKESFLEKSVSGRRDFRKVIVASLVDLKGDREFRRGKGFKGYDNNLMMSLQLGMSCATHGVRMSAGEVIVGASLVPYRPIVPKGDGTYDTAPYKPAIGEVLVRQ
jgi:hypothetical protein